MAARRGASRRAARRPPGRPLSAPLPGACGAYAVELWLDRPHTLPVGRLGLVSFPAGAYLYLGSACGPGGLRGRLARHLQGKGAARPHWHIDTLRAAAQVRAYAALVLPGEHPILAGWECQLSRLALDWPGAVVVAPGFGASDCRSSCPAHLVGFPWAQPGQPPLLLQAAFLAALTHVVEAAGGQLLCGIGAA